MYSLVIRQLSVTVLAIVVGIALVLSLALPRASEGATAKKSGEAGSGSAGKGASVKKAPASQKAAPSKKKLKGASVSSALDEDEDDEAIDDEDGDEENGDDEDLDGDGEDLDDLDDEGDGGDGGDEGDTGEERSPDENVQDVAPWKVEEALSAIEGQRGVITFIRGIAKEWKLELVLVDELKELKAIEPKLAKYEKALKQKVVLWETVDAFAAEDFGRQTDPIQRRAELHRTISEIQTAKKTLKDLIKNKKFARSLVLLGGDIGKLKAALPKFTAAADDALAALKELADEDEITSEDINDVMETLREEGNDPITLAGFLSGIKDFEKELKLNQIADKNLRKSVTAIVRDLFEDIVAALSAGDIDGATEAIEDLNEANIVLELPKLIDKAIEVSKRKKRKAKDLTKILDQFKALDAALDAADAEEETVQPAAP